MTGMHPLTIHFSLAMLLAGMLLASATSCRASAGCHALLIGISDYSQFDSQRPCYPDGQPIIAFLPIHCDEDLVSMETALKQKFNFSDADIRVLKDSDATRRNILNAFDSLVKETRPGDIVYIHYSGHGSQVADPTEPDGLDSTIVPIDYTITASQTTPAAATESETREISGKTIREKLEALESQDHPKQIILSFDCCNSGLATRGAVVDRGMTYLQVSDLLVEHGAKPLPTPVVDSTVAVSRGPASTSVFGDLAHANYVVFEACRSDEEDQETTANGVSIGPLSYCLSRAFETAEQGATYQQIFDQVQAEFLADHPSQHPQLDGGNPDAALFGDIPANAVGSIPVTLSPDKSKCLLLAGMFQEVTAGSIFAIYKKGSANFLASDKIATATVKSVNESTSLLQPVVPVDPAHFAPSDIEGAEAVERTHNFSGKPPLTFDASSVRSTAPAQSDAILTAVRALKCATTEYLAGAIPDVRLMSVGSTTVGAAGLALARGGPNGALYQTLDMSSDIAQQVSDDLQAISRYRYALTLSPPESAPSGAIDVDVKIVPATSQTGGDGYQHWKVDAPLPPAGFQVGMVYTIQVRNRGDEPAHVGILDIDSNSEISLDWPPPNYTLQDNVIPANSGWVRLWDIDSGSTEPKLYQFTSPDDAELFKAVATKDYVDLRLLAAGTRDASSPFSPLLDGELTSRSGETAAAPAVWSARSTTVDVAPPPLGAGDSAP